MTPIVAAILAVILLAVVGIFVSAKRDAKRLVEIQAAQRESAERLLAEARASENQRQAEQTRRLTEDIEGRARRRIPARRMPPYPSLPDLPRLPDLPDIDAFTESMRRFRDLTRHSVTAVATGPGAAVAVSGRDLPLGCTHLEVVEQNGRRGIIARAIPGSRAWVEAALRVQYGPDFILVTEEVGAPAPPPAPSVEPPPPPPATVHERLTRDDDLV